MRHCAHVIRPRVPGRRDDGVNRRQTGNGYQQASKWCRHDLASVLPRLARSNLRCAQHADIEWLIGSGKALDSDMVERIAPFCR